MTTKRFLAVHTLVTLGVAGVCAMGPQFGRPVLEPAVEPPQLWRIAESARGAPVSDGTAVYFLTTRHEVVAVEAASGRTRWRSQTNETGDLLVSGAAALISGPHLVVGDYNLLALDREDGGLKWRFVPAPGFAPGVYLGAIADGVAFTGSASGHVYAVDAERGALHWSTSLGEDGRTTVYGPVTNGVVVAAAFTEFSAPPRGGVALLDVVTGRVLWTRRFPAPDDPGLATSWAGGPVFAGATVVAASADGNVRAFDLETGDLRWTIPRLDGRLPFPVASDHDFRALAIDGNLLISSSSTGLVVAYDLTTRAERWRYLAWGLGSAAFRISAEGGRAFVPFLNGLLLSLDAGTGLERWRMGTYQSGFLWPPAVVGDRVYAAGGGDGLVAVEDPR